VQRSKSRLDDDDDDATLLLLLLRLVMQLVGTEIDLQDRSTAAERVNNA